MHQQHFHYIIVGQGIAGTLLAHHLWQAGQRVLVIDNQHHGASSAAAAGIINPITGRRYVKSWRMEALLPAAQRTYEALEVLLGISCYHPRRVLRTMSNAKELNDWLLRSADPGYAQYILDEADIGAYREKINPAFGYGEVQHGAQVNLPLLINHYANWLKTEERLHAKVFNFNDLEFLPQGVRYENIRADRLIFCEGAAMKKNPFFNYLPMRGDKGEALLVRIPGAGFEKILKQRLFIVPLGTDDHYWIGATYHPNYTDELPSEASKSWLLTQLQQLLRVPFEVVEHLAAVRPTVRDRRPLIGLHPQWTQVGIFNGLGTKGASLGPFWAAHFTEFLLHGTELDAEVDIRRFDL